MEAFRNRSSLDITLGRIANMRVRDVRELGRRLADLHPGFVMELQAGIMEQQAGLMRERQEQVLHEPSLFAEQDDATGA